MWLVMFIHFAKAEVIRMSGRDSFSRCAFEDLRKELRAEVSDCNFISNSTTWCTAVYLIQLVLSILGLT